MGKSEKLNIGMDLELFRSLNLTADFFYDKRYDILLLREAWPESLGYYTAKPWSNKEEVDNWGFEFSANYHQKVTKDLSMDLLKLHLHPKQICGCGRPNLQISLAIQHWQTA